ncbi:ABC transporter permease subunit [Cereibacter sp. SYSU M97828]|nr:ABC transporter permease subunit [Cereibacter flavus]
MPAISLLYVLFLLAPPALLLLGSFGQSWSNTLLPQGFTTQWYSQVFSDPSFRRAFAASLTVVGATCALNLMIGLPLAYALYHSSRRWLGAAGKVLTLLPMAVPELVLAFGFILTFSSDSLPWLGSTWLLIAAHTVITLPYTVNTVLAGMKQVGLARYEQAAASLGSAPMQRFMHIALPLVSASVTSTMLMVAALSLGEFQLSNLISGFLNRTYPVVLLQAFYGATGFACAATVILLGLALIASAGARITAAVAGRT